MPFGGIERGDQAVSQATVRARELARQEQAQFMADYKAGRLNPTPFPNLAPITEAFDAARHAQAAPVLSDEQRAACRVLLREAAAAIRSADAEAFGFALGPNFASCKRKYAEDTRALYWQYLSLLTQLAIAGRREEILLNFASSNANPENLSAYQQSALREELSSRFNPELRSSRFIIPRAWAVNPEFSSIAQHEASSLFEQEHSKIQSERNTTNLPVALRQVKQKSEDLKHKISALKARLEELAKADAVLMQNDAQASWKLFRTSYAGHHDLEQRVQTLKESGLTLVSLAELEDKGQLLLELAAQRYGAMQDPGKRAALRRCMETLVSHGSQLNTEVSAQSLDWRALSRILPHASAPTPRVAAKQVALIKYTQESAQQVQSSLWLLFHSAYEKEKRCGGVRDIALAFFLAPASTLAEQEQRILTAMEKAREQAKPMRLTAGGLFSALSITGSREAAAQPLLLTGGGELKTFGNYGLNS